MLLLVVVTLLSPALAQALKAENCTLTIKEENEYECPLPNATITLSMKKNDYVIVECQGSNINCADIPVFDFGSGQPLGSIGLKHCPPSILRCIKNVITIPSVDRVTLEWMTEPLTGEDVGNLGAINTFTLRNANVQHSVPIEAIRNLPTLREVRLGGGNMTLIPHAFEGAPPLTYLEFNQDHLTSIPPDSFSGLSNLIHLNIWYNDIENITVGAFRGLDELRKLSLSTNKLRTIEPGTFDTLLNLRVLYFMKNKIELLPNGLLGNLKKLENFTLIYNEVELTFGSHTFANLPALKNIDLQFNRIRMLSESLFKESTNIELLSLIYNQIEEVPAKIFKSMLSLKRLDMSHNRVKMLHKTIFYPLKQLEYLNMNYNNLETLPEELFAGLNNLKEIYFDHNNLVSLSYTTFGRLTEINIISFAYNKLSLNNNGNSIKYDLLNHNDTSFNSPFRDLIELKKLNLVGNQISIIFEDWRLILNRLEYLDLRYNKFTEVGFDESPISSYFLNPNLTVDLRYNEIDRIYLSRGPYRRDEPKDAVTVLLDNNPFKCDCHMYSVKLRLDGDVLMANEPKLVLNDARCSLPLDLTGIRLKDVSPVDLVCNLSDENSANCTTIARPATNELLFNCPIFPSVLPDTKDVALLDYFNKEPTITVKSKRPPKFLDGLDVHKLVLSDIGLDSIDFKPSKHLRILDLSNNNINKIPQAFLDANVSLYLLNNSLECSCDTSDDIAMLKSYKYVYNATCETGRVITQIDVPGLCNVRFALAISFSTFFFIACCAAFIGILIYKYFNEIIVFMITRNICNNCVKRSGSDKEYDAFISFAHDDHELVDKILLPKLENEFGQKVCVHYRDWLVGGVIPEQIQYSVDNSRKIIIILSKGFLESIWANLEFFTAHNVARQENSSRIILILLDENLAHHSKLSAELRAYISTNTYLLRDDPNFWKKLETALETKSYSITCLEAFKCRTKTEEHSKDERMIKDKKPVFGSLDVQLLNGQLVNVAAQPKGIVNLLAYDSV